MQSLHLPRAIIAVLVGACLAISGAIAFVGLISQQKLEFSLSS